MKKTTEAIRAKKMIDSDRFGFVSGSEALIRRDAEELLNEYFCLTKSPKIKIEGDGERFSVTIEADGCLIRQFNMLK